MTQHNETLLFEAELRRPKTPDSQATWTFVILPKPTSEKLPRRGRTTVEGTLNDQPFRATLEPDGQLSHWLAIPDELREAAEVEIGDVVMFAITPVKNEPEPDVPSDLQEALATSPAASRTWNDTTTLARLDWIHWITSAKQIKTRAKRIGDTCDMLAAGKRRVCCFDPSGYYSKAFGAPESTDREGQHSDQ